MLKEENNFMTANTKSNKRLDLARKNLKLIETKIISNNVTKSDLKRSLTGEPKYLRRIYSVTSYLEGVAEHNKDEWILIAGLFAYYYDELKPYLVWGDSELPKDFGTSLQALSIATKPPNEPESKAVVRKCRALLDTSLENIRSPLSALVRQMKSHSITIDYPKLIVDLCQWNHSDQYIQDQWAKSFWGYQSPKDEPHSPTEANN
jgi:CRISPR system Cascade subunit CasB